MSATKEMWVDAVEAVCTEFAFEHLSHDEAMNRLVRLGIDLDEAETMLIEAVS